MLKICYKVVRQWHDGWVSAVAKNELAREYTIGVPTYPKIGKILVFDTPYDAKEFAKEHMISGAILCGVAENPAPVVHLACSLFWEDVQAVWGEAVPHHSVATFTPPRGTLGCDCFLPTKRVISA